MYNLSKKLQNFAPYKPTEPNIKIRLDSNESFIPVPKEKITSAIEKVSLNRYPDPCATLAIESFASLFGVSPELVTAGNGSDELIGIICAGLMEKGGRILTLKPDFFMYTFCARLNELDVVEFSKNPDFTINADDIIDFIKNNRIDCVILSNPCNPTSLGTDKSEIIKLVSSVPDALVVLDEAYMDFWSEEQSLLREIGNFDNLIILRTCSKSMALAGIRMGFAVSGKKITHILKTAKAPFNVDSITQAIAAEVLSDANWYKNSIKLIKDSVKSLYKSVEELNLFEKIYDTKTNFIFAKTADSSAIYEYLLNAGIAVRRFENHLRICAGTDEENRELIKAMKTYKMR